MTATPEPTDWLTDELMQRAAKLIQDIDGIASQGTVYVVSRALYEAEKRGREEAAKIAVVMAERARQMSKDDTKFNKFDRRDFDSMSIAYAQAAAAIRSGQ